MKYLIHTYPKREWYVNKFLVPDMLNQGIKRTDITILSDRKGLGNLKAYLVSLKYVTETTCHLQDDVLVSSTFKERCDILGKTNLICTGYYNYNFNKGTMFNFGVTNPVFLNYSFPCIIIPKRYTDDFPKWIEANKDKYKDLIDTNKNDDLLFYKFVCERYPNDEIINVREPLVDHIDYLIGGSSLGNRETNANSSFWKETELNRELERRLKEYANNKA